MQMSWQRKEACFMLISVLMLTSSAFHLETVPNGKLAQVGRLGLGSDRTRNETKDGIAKKLNDERAGETHGSQADQPELRGWSQLAKLKLRRLSPSVQCDNDSMTLHIQGSQVPSFLVKTNERGPVPLSQMPSHCGFSMKRARRDVALTAKYDACNVEQQGDSFILPLRVLGVNVDMVCPVACLIMVSCSPTAMLVHLGMSPDAVRLKVNGLWQPLYQASSCGFTLEAMGRGLTLTAPYTSNCWQFKGGEMFLPIKYTDVEMTLSCPVDQLPAVTPLPNMQPGTPTGAPVTTTTTLATTVAPPVADQPALPYWLPVIRYPYAYSAPLNFQYSGPGIPPVTPVTKAPATTVAPASADQRALYQWLAAMYYAYPYSVPWQSRYSNPVIPPVPPTTKAPTRPATPVAPASADQQAFYAWLLGLYNPQYGMPYLPFSQSGFPPATTTAPTSTPPTPTTTVAPSSNNQQLYPLLPGMYNPYIPVVSPGVPVSGSNSGVEQLRYQNGFVKGLTLYQKPGSPLVNPSNVGPYPYPYPPQWVGRPRN